MLKNCIVCQEEFDGRADAKTCSQNCRKEYSRVKETIHREQDKAIRAVGNMARILKKRPDLKEYIESKLAELSQKIEITLSGEEAEETKRPLSKEAEELRRQIMERIRLIEM